MAWDPGITWEEYRGLTVEGSKTWLGENWPWLVGGAAVVVVAGVVLKAVF
jgi:hypothetical protein